MVLFKENLSCMSKDELVKMVLELQRDSLTGVYKREVLDNLKRESYAVCLMDINGLKQVNDNFGHDAGDNYIISVVNIIKTLVRKDDIVVRYGGDEFLIIFNDVNINNIDNIKERLNKKASCGFAINKNLRQAITMADKDMYTNKTNYYNSKETIIWQL